MRRSRSTHSFDELIAVGDVEGPGAVHQAGQVRQHFGLLGLQRKITCMIRRRRRVLTAVSPRDGLRARMCSAKLSSSSGASLLGPRLWGLLGDLRLLLLLSLRLQLDLQRFGGVGGRR